MNTSHNRRRQGGAVIVTVALFLLFLLGFMGIALDFGRLYVVRTELQTAMDSCALAAAQELDGLPGATARGRSAGRTAGNLNRVNLQSPNWSGQGQLVDASINFFDASYSPAATDASARYAECLHVQPNIQLWLLQVMGAFTGDAAANPSTARVRARAVATRSSSQTTCPLPLALFPKGGSGGPGYGFAVGEWVRLLNSPGAASNGEIGWANLDGSNSAAETRREVEGYCGTRVGDTLGTPGVQTTVADPWNARFGLYGGSTTPADAPPDYTGYSYTSLNWPARANAYDGPAPAGIPTAQNYVTKRAAFASCADTGTRVRGANSCESITGLSLNSFSRVAAPGAAASGGHRTYGASRRLAPVPVVDGSRRVVAFACMFMLQPLTIPMSDVWLEYRGNANEPGSPCAPAGVPGGTAGPLVPVLVR
jgi:hypothetical protein